MKNKKLKRIISSLLLCAMIISFIPINMEKSHAIESETIQLKDIPRGSVIYDPSWTWEFRTGPEYSGFGEIKPLEWVVVTKNHYSDLEDSVTVLSKDTIGFHTYGGSRVDWNSSDVRKWLNGSSYSGTNSNPYNYTFYDSFSETFKDYILETTFNMRVRDDYETVKNKVFLPSVNEMGCYYVTSDGTSWSYFSDNTSRVATFNGNAESYLTRTGYINSYSSSDRNVKVVSKDGDIGSKQGGASAGVRPALNLRPDTPVCINPENWQEGQLILGELPENYQTSNSSSIANIIVVNNEEISGTIKGIKIKGEHSGIIFEVNGDDTVYSGTPQNIPENWTLIENLDEGKIWIRSIPAINTEVKTINFY